MGQKSPIFAPGRRGGSVFPLRRIWKTDCKGLFWAFWAWLWRLLGSGNAGIPPATKTAVRGVLGLLCGCREKAPSRLGSGAGCGCCCGGLGGAVRFDLGRGKAGTRAAGAWAILGSCGGHKKSPGAVQAPGLGGLFTIIKPLSIPCKVFRRRFCPCIYQHISTRHQVSGITRRIDCTMSFLQVYIPFATPSLFGDFQQLGENCQRENQNTD